MLADNDAPVTGVQRHVTPSKRLRGSLQCALAQPRILSDAGDSGLHLLASRFRTRSVRNGPMLLLTWQHFRVVLTGLEARATAPKIVVTDAA